MKAEMNVIINNRPATKYSYQGHTLIEGISGTEYKIRIRNNLVERILVVLSVDGLSVIDGQMAYTKSPGYIIAGKSSMDIPGWRLSNSEVAKFEFGSIPDSYAASKNMENHAGVIGAMIFFEKTEKPNEWSRYSVSTPATKSSGLGTVFGSRSEHNVRSEHFERESAPCEVLTIRYTDAAGLIERGVKLASDPLLDAQPFQDFCQPPHGWQK